MKFKLARVKVFDDLTIKATTPGCYILDSKFAACQKVVYDSPGLVDFAAGPVDSVLCFEYSFNFKLISPAQKKKIPFLAEKGSS